VKRLAVIVALALAACGDNNVRPPPDARPDRPDAAEEDPDAGVDELVPCLDRPTDLARPPTGPLPCDLLPPGFSTR
jgi:hypothetical protein